MSKLKHALPLIAFSFLFAFMVSCSASKKASTSSVKLNNYRNADLLIEEITKNNISSEWLSTKTQIQYKTDKSNQSVTAQIRVKRDSAIWISVTPFLGIEVARILITPDSVKYLDRFNKKYSAKSITSLKSYIPIEGDFFTVQNILYANLFSYSDNTIFKTVYTNNNQYIISNLPKRAIKNIIKNNSPVAINQHHAWITADNYRVSKHLIVDPMANHNIEIIYSDFKTGDYGVMPVKTELQVSSYEKVFVSLKHLRIFQNKHKELPFSVPNSYEWIN